MGIIVAYVCFCRIVNIEAKGIFNLRLLPIGQIYLQIYSCSPEHLFLFLSELVFFGELNSQLFVRNLILY